MKNLLIIVICAALFTECDHPTKKRGNSESVKILWVKTDIVANKRIGSDRIPTEEYYTIRLINATDDTIRFMPYYQRRDESNFYLKYGTDTVHLNYISEQRHEENLKLYPNSTDSIILVSDYFIKKYYFHGRSLTEYYHNIDSNFKEVKILYKNSPNNNVFMDVEKDRNFRITRDSN
jgi:hypothetical protein